MERTLAEDRNNGFATAVGGDALAVLGQMERSEAWMERALLMEPDNVLVRLNIAGTLAAYTERVDDALDTLAPALLLRTP